MSDITFQMTANDADVTKALQNLVKENAKLREEIAKGVQQSKEEAQAAKQAAEAQKQHSQALKEAEGITKANMTASERYAAQVAKLNQLKSQGVLSSRDHARALEAERKKMAESGESTGTFGSTLQSLGTKLVASAAGFMSIQQALALVGDEIRGVMNLQKKAGDSTINLAIEQEALLANLGGANAQQVAGELKKLSQRSGIGEADITRAVNESMAARGDFNVGEVINAVGSVGKIRKFAPTETAGLAAATIDTQRQTGLGTDQALGFLLQLQGQSRTKGLKELAANVVPGIGGVMQFGADRQTAGALLASLTHGMGDTTGAASRTAALNLAGQLRNFGGGAPIAQTLQSLQQNAALRDQFLSTASFEVAARPAIESLLSGGKVAGNFGAARKALSANPLDALAQAEADRKAFSQIGLAERAGALANVANQGLLNNSRAAEAGIVRQGLEDIFASMPGSSPIVGKARSALREYESGLTPNFEAAVNEIQSAVAARRKGIDDSVRRDSYVVDETAKAFLPGSGFILPSSEGQFALRNLVDRDFQRQTELMSQTVTLLQALLDQGKDGKNQGAAVGRANQREGAGT